ncbi:MAG: LysR family transcriptional regulator substrate-binding protein, partial [Verrucomicrobiota bacterium]
HELARRKSLDLKSIDGQRFISFEPDLPTRKAIDGMFTNAGVRVKEVVEFDNIETVKRGVLIENAISIVPSDSVRPEVEAGTLVQVPIEGKFIWRPLGIVRRRTKAITPAMREMIHLLKEGGDGGRSSKNRLLAADDPSQEEAESEGSLAEASPTES